MKSTENFLTAQLLQREAAGTLRSLSQAIAPIDFCSNDYLGLARSEALANMVKAQQTAYPANGATGSRLLSGNTKYVEETEQFIADYHQAAAGLIFNAGYDANVGLLSSIAKRGDTIITDEWIHASIIDGARLSHADRYKFKHNDITDLESKLKIATGNIFVAIESVYSMDGDIAPLLAISALCTKYNAYLIVDEAHATGVLGPNGAGLVQELGIQEQVFARVITFGKALGCHGAIVVGSKILRSYLINFARSFIYTTAAPVHNIITIRSAYQLLAAIDQNSITSKIMHYNQLIAKHFPGTAVYPSAIKTVFFNGVERTRYAAKQLQEKGMDVRPIVSPTVLKGTERLRICLHAYNTIAEIDGLMNELIELKRS